jgi:hypothetical protein
MPKTETKNKTPQKTQQPDNATETAIEAREEVNPYKDYPLSIPELLRAILCEIWEVRRCLTKN